MSDLFDPPITPRRCELSHSGGGPRPGRAGPRCGDESGVAHEEMSLARVLRTHSAGSSPVAGGRRANRRTGDRACHRRGAHRTRGGRRGGAGRGRSRHGRGEQPPARLGRENNAPGAGATGTAATSTASDAATILSRGLLSLLGIMSGTAAQPWRLRGVHCPAEEARPTRLSLSLAEEECRAVVGPQRRRKDHGPCASSSACSAPTPGRVLLYGRDIASTSRDVATGGPSGWKRHSTPSSRPGRTSAAARLHGADPEHAGRLTAR